MRVLSFNANGIRAAARKGFFDWLAEHGADVVCVQEIRAQTVQLGDPAFRPKGYHCYYLDAEKRGYSGVAIYSRREPDEVIEGLGLEEFDREARYLELRFGNLAVASVYLPSGSSSEQRQEAKYRFLDGFLPHLKTLAGRGGDSILCGDWNIAHREIDLKNWKGNRKNSGFLPEERAWMDRVFGETGLVDAFRVVNPEPEQYTWWSNRGQAWAKNVGWRIDYHVVTPGVRNRILEVSIYKAQRFSDHAPLTIDYAIDL